MKNKIDETEIMLQELYDELDIDIVDKRQVSFEYCLREGLITEEEIFEELNNGEQWNERIKWDGRNIK